MARALITGCSTGIGRAAPVELTKREPVTLKGLDGEHMTHAVGGARDQ